MSATTARRLRHLDAAGRARVRALLGRCADCVPHVTFEQSSGGVWSANVRHDPTCAWLPAEHREAGRRVYRITEPELLTLDVRP